MAERSCQDTEWNPTPSQKLIFSEWNRHLQMMLLIRGEDEGTDVVKSLVELECLLGEKVPFKDMGLEGCWEFLWVSKDSFHIRKNEEGAIFIYPALEKIPYKPEMFHAFRKIVKNHIPLQKKVKAYKRPHFKETENIFFQLQEFKRLFREGDNNMNLITKSIHNTEVTIDQVTE